MISINRQDVMKTLVIIWFVAATGYVAYDQYLGYKVRGMQAASTAGYAQAVDDLMVQAEKNGCQPFEVKKDDVKISLVNGQCLQQQTASEAAPAQGVQKK